MDSLTTFIRLKLFAVSSEEVKFDVRNFSYENERVRSHLETIGLSFLKGYHAYLKMPELDTLHLYLNTISEEFRGFAFEGSAMAVTLLDFLRPWRRPQLPKFIEGAGQSHIYMLHVGAGWALARLPVKPEKALGRLHPLYKWLAIDGYGFHQAYFHTKRYVKQRKSPKNLSREALPVFYQGLGRGLWFVEGAVPSAVHKVVHTFPEELRPNLWSGIGLAAAYAGGVKESSLRELATLAEQHHTHLAQGIAFAAKARLRADNFVPHTRKACLIITGLEPEKLAAITDESLKILDGDFERPGSYERWRKNIRQSVSEQMKNHAKI